MPTEEDFDWNAFIDDTNELPLAAVGAWIKCLHKMRKSVTRGRISMPIEGYARMFGSSVDQTQRVIDELITFGTANSEAGSEKNITLINRRMYREWQAVEANRIRQLRFQQEHGAESSGENNGQENNGKITIQPNSYKEEGLSSLDVRRKSTKKKTEEVFDFWKTTLDHPNAKLTKERDRLISARLTEGYSVDELKNAVLGCSKSGYHQGKNDERKVYDAIELICRNGSNVERFIGYTRVAPAPGQIGLHTDTPEPERKCSTCFDRGVALTADPEAEFGWVEKPCPDCAEAVAA